MTKPNPHLGISSTTAILYIILPPHHCHPYHGNRDMCELLCGGQSYQALGPLGPLLPLALIALDTMYMYSKSMVLCECYILYNVDVADTNYFFTNLHFLVCSRHYADAHVIDVSFW